MRWRIALKQKHSCKHAIGSSVKFITNDLGVESPRLETVG
jgi:hypothetical protein